MRPLLVLLLLAASGCDLYSEALTDEAPAVMSSLDGMWTRTITQERIARDGTVTPVGSPRVDAYDIARSVVCNRITLTNVSDSDRVTVSFDPSAPPGSLRSCGVIEADTDGARIIFIGDGAISTDVAGMIRERGRSRHVWHVYTPLAGGEARRDIWTLTPRG